MAGADRYAEAVRKATYGRETRVPIVSAIEYWLDSADRLRIVIRKMIETISGDGSEFDEAAEAFYKRNHPMVDDTVDRLTSQYGNHITTITLINTGKQDYYTLAFNRANGQ